MTRRVKQAKHMAAIVFTAMNTFQMQKRMKPLFANHVTKSQGVN